MHVTGLEPGTAYDYRLIVENTSGPSAPGEGVGTFTTPIPMPLLGAESVSGVGASDATLAGTVATEGARTRYWFEYGETEALGQSTPGGEVPAGSERGVGGTRSDLRPGVGHRLLLPAAGSEPVARSLRPDADVHDREQPASRLARQLTDHPLRWPVDHLTRWLGTGRILDPAHDPAAPPGTDRFHAGAEKDGKEGREVQARPEA